LKSNKFFQTIVTDRLNKGYYNPIITFRLVDQITHANHFSSFLLANGLTRNTRAREKEKESKA
jgi:hypothetical protein